MTAEMRRQQVIVAAKAWLKAGTEGNPSEEAISRYLATLGVDLTDAGQLIAFGTLTDGLRYGVPTPTAFARLGCAS